MLPKFLRCSQARKANFLFLLVLAKKSQCSACSRMLAKTICHPSFTYAIFANSLTLLLRSLLLNRTETLATQAKNTRVKNTVCGKRNQDRIAIHNLIGGGCRKSGDYYFLVVFFCFLTLIDRIILRQLRDPSKSLDLVDT